MKQGLDFKLLKYKAKWFPFGPLFAFALCIVVIAGQNYNAFLGDTIDWYGMAVSYIGIPAFLAIYLGYKFVKKTKVVPLEQMDLSNTKHADDAAKA